MKVSSTLLLVLALEASAAPVAQPDIIDDLLAGGLKGSSGSGGLPDLSALAAKFGGSGGAGGLPDLSALASKFGSGGGLPDLSALAAKFGGSGGAGSLPDLSALASKFGGSHAAGGLPDLSALAAKFGGSGGAGGLPSLATLAAKFGGNGGAGGLPDLSSLLSKFTGGSGGLSSLLTSKYASGGAGGGTAAEGAPSAPASASSGSLLSGLGSLGSLAGGLQMSRSDITGGNFQCKKAALLFARGTGEPGNMGYVVGPPLSTALSQRLGGNLLVQGSDYSTTFTSGASKDFVQQVNQISSKCPQTKIILAGYSQGAMNVHSALSSLGAASSKVAAAVTFGDPYGGFKGGFGSFVGGSGSFPAAKGLSICNSGDPVCSAMAGGQSVQGGGSGHLGYRGDNSIKLATDFIAKTIG